MHGLWYKFLRMIDHLDAQEWALILLAAIAVGFFCLRGFGSRSDY